MKADTYSRENQSFQVLNLLTNVLTVFLFIVYGLVKRIDTANWVIYLLLASFTVNFILSIYAFYVNKRDKPEYHQRNNIWLIVRIVANLGFTVLTYFLIK